MIKFDNTKFMEAMAQMKKEVFIEMTDVMRWQIGLWTRDIIKKIYANPGWWGATDGTGRRARRELEEIVEKDIYKVFEALDREDQVYDTKAKRGRTKNIYGMPLVKTSSGAVYLIDPMKYIPYADNSIMEDIHDKHRSHGKVSQMLLNTRVKGLTVKGAYVVKASAFNRYVKFKTGHVGKGKAAWCKAYSFFKGKVSAMNLLPWNPPKWIQRHALTMANHGVAGESLGESAMKGEWFAGSNLDWGKNPQHSVDSTWPTRLKDLQSGMALKRLQSRILKFQAKEAKVA